MAGINASDFPIHCIAILDIKETETKYLKPVEKNGTDRPCTANTVARCHMFDEYTRCLHPIEHLWKDHIQQGDGAECLSSSASKNLARVGLVRLLSSHRVLTRATSWSIAHAVSTWP